MSKYSFQIVLSCLAVAAFFVLTSCYSESQKIELQLPASSWEPIFFKLINKTTELGGIDELRDLRLRGDDLEVRIWRGFGLQNLEGVILRRTNNKWNAIHIGVDDDGEPHDDYADVHKVSVTSLDPPKSGWENFWSQLNNKGLLVLRDPSEINCLDSGIDGTGYVVEINQNMTYRTYEMREEGKCPGVYQMEQIDDLIGVEFDSGREACKTAEWFACATIRKSRRIAR